MARLLHFVRNDKNKKEVVMSVENKIVELDLNSITVSHLNPRKHIDEKKLAELTASIKEHGVLQHIVVREFTEKNYEYEIVFGERRYRASVAAGKKTILAEVRDFTDAQMLECQMIENLQRDEMGALDEAKAFKKMLEQFKNTVSTLADKVSKPVKYIKARLQLLILPEVIQRAIATGVITANHGLILSRILDPNAQLKLCNKIIDSKLSVNATENMLRYSGKDLSDATFDITDCKKCKKLGCNQTLDLFDKDTDIDNICMDGVCWEKKERELGKKKPKIEKVEVRKLNYREELEKVIIDKILDSSLVKLEAVAKMLGIDIDKVKGLLTSVKPVAKLKQEKKEQVCRVCKQTDKQIVKDGLKWDEPDLCSKCKKKGMKTTVKVTSKDTVTPMTHEQKKAADELAGMFGGKK